MYDKGIHPELDGHLKEFVELGNPGIGNALYELYKDLWDGKQVVFQHQCTPVIYFLDPCETCQAYKVNQGGLLTLALQCGC